MNKLDELKAALAAATPGEWAVDNNKNALAFPGFEVRSTGTIPSKVLAIAAPESDAHLIALMHNMLPDLLEAVTVVEAIHARITGEYGNPALMLMGALESPSRDINRWCTDVLEKLK
jgi:hypothetical protein